MQFTMEAAHLARIVGAVKGCVPSRTTLPLLQHVLIEAANGIVSVRASAMDMEASAGSPAAVDTDGTITLHAGVLHDLTKRLPKLADVTLKLKDDLAVVTSGHSRFALRTLPATDFPIMTPADGCAFTVPSADLLGLLEATIGATSSSVARWYFGGIFVHIRNGQIAAVATDDHRMVYRETALPAGAENMPGMVVPTDAARQIIAMLDRDEGQAEVRASATLLTVRAGGAEFSTRLLTEGYPPYDRVLGAAWTHEFTVHADALAEAVDRASVVFQNSTEKVPAVGLLPTREGLKVLCGGRGTDDACEVVDAEIKEPAEELAIAVKYLSEMLKLWPDQEIVIRASDRTKPVFFFSPKNPALQGLIMTMKR
jgi:DNA polymerase-3 subunit beta